MGAVGYYLIRGISMGSIYALIALGLTMVYGVLRILHIAHAGIYVLGAYLGLVFYTYTNNFILSLAVAMVGCGVAGILIHRLIYRPLLGSPRIVPLIASIGLFIMLEDLYRLIAGPYILPFPVNLRLKPLVIGEIIITNRELVILMATGILLGLVWFLSNRTKIGLGWRAAAQDLETALCMGVNTNRIIAINFLLGSILAATAGVLIGIYHNSVYPTMGGVPAYKALAVIVLGGLGSITGTVVAGFLIGLVETFLVGTIGYLLPRDAIAFVALILVLMLRPHGLLGPR